MSKITVREQDIGPIILVIEFKVHHVAIINCDKARVKNPPQIFKI